MKNATVYSITSHLNDPEDVIQVLTHIGLGRGTVADECRKIAAVNGPRASIYRDAHDIIARTRNAPRECAGMGGA